MTPCAATTKRGTRCANRAKVSETLCAVHLGVAHRRSKLTEDLQHKITALLRNGNYVETACGAAGISVSTFYAWMERGEADERAGTQSAFLEFSEAVHRTRAEGEALLLQQIRQAAPTDWRAAAWILERTAPERFGRRTEIKHDGTLRTSVQQVPETEERLLTIVQLMGEIGVIGPLSEDGRDG